MAVLIRRRYTRVTFVLAQPTLMTYRIGLATYRSRGLFPDRRREFVRQGRDTWLDVGAPIVGGLVPTCLLWFVGYAVIWSVLGPVVRSLPPGAALVADAVLWVLYLPCVTVQVAPYLAWLLFPGSAPRKILQPRDALLLNGLAWALAVPLGVVLALGNPL